jgi:hypothetical protein
LQGETRSATNVRDTIMRTLHLLTAAAGILLAISGPSLAASRTQARAADAYSAFARDNSDNTYLYSPYLNDPWTSPRASSRNVPAGPTFYSYGAGQNLPYPDRPYGNPGSW